MSKKKSYATGLSLSLSLIVAMAQGEKLSRNDFLVNERTELVL